MGFEPLTVDTQNKSLTHPATEHPEREGQAVRYRLKERVNKIEREREIKDRESSSR